MKKTVIGTIIVNCLFVFGAISSIVVGNGSDRDYAFLFIAVPALILDIGYLIYRHTKTKKKASKAKKPKDSG